MASLRQDLARIIHDKFVLTHQWHFPLSPHCSQAAFAISAG